ncbi:acyl-CoA dehydrogenase family protein [Kineococcus rhizosphaerae]|uniref:Alkylation response protein AidB-like acyl-CoA dehydrogenase n=1 Tax=Kineococcus rhizosphaerae TaxID=559628 RepID=A0A2T0R7V5_9ACTN|nr:acyl-CoA dehydrogenase family protein [Kineococcus rhizosphaerae]PRY17232.1 alkylation response protein AidB-like acyl-CoA dehydrogenase [Kineococcus rhizosphaerae]
MLTRPSAFAPPAGEAHWLDVVRELAVGFAERAPGHDADSTLPLENLQALNASGLDVAVLPAPHGGGLSFATIGAALVEISAACPATAALWLMHAGAAHGLVSLSEPTAARFYAAELAAGRRFANALSEPSSGNLFLTPQQSATPVEGGWRLDGAKRFVSGCEVADHFLTNVLVGGVPTFFGVAKDDSVSFAGVWDAMGMRATRSQLVSFAGTVLREERRCAVPPPTSANLISVGLPFLSLGIARAAVDAASEHARGRFLPGVGDVLASLQWVRFEMAGLHVALRGAFLMAEQVAWLADRDDPQATPAAVEAKLAANEVAKAAAALGVKIGGASGYLSTSPIQRHFRDAQAGALMAYSVEVCSDVVGTWVVQSPR